jgi:hypothetical protein
MESSSNCSCRLGAIVRFLGLQSRPLPRKRQWQLISSILLLGFASVFFVAIARNDHHGILMLGVIGFFGLMTLAMGLLSAVVGLAGCDDCVSRM